MCEQREIICPTFFISQWKCFCFFVFLPTVASCCGGFPVRPQANTVALTFVQLCVCISEVIGVQSRDLQPGCSVLVPAVWWSCWNVCNSWVWRGAEFTPGQACVVCESFADSSGCLKSGQHEKRAGPVCCKHEQASSEGPCFNWSGNTRCHEKLCEKSGCAFPQAVPTGSAVCSPQTFRWLSQPVLPGRHCDLRPSVSRQQHRKWLRGRNCRFRGRNHILRGRNCRFRGGNQRLRGEQCRCPQPCDRQGGAASAGRDGGKWEQGGGCRSHHHLALCLPALPVPEEQHWCVGQCSSGQYSQLLVNLSECEHHERESARTPP